MEAPTEGLSCPCGRKGEFRCQVCRCERLRCQACLLAKHQDLWLHRIERWTGHHFIREELTSLGLVVDLNPAHTTCHGHEDRTLVVIDVSGVHRVTVKFCCCQSLSKPVQLLRARLLPATTTDPQTCATFEALREFRQSSFVSKKSAYSYLKHICRLTDNTGVSSLPPLFRYQQWLHMIRMWRHLMMCKQSGLGNVVNGRKNMKRGELAVLCPMCPRLGVNLSVTPPERRYELSAQLVMDANFHLRRYNKGAVDDEPLNRGAAYMVDDKEFAQHMKEFGKARPEIPVTPPCNQHNAVLQASIERKGAVVTGVGQLTCARHDITLPSMVNLRRGEEHSVMDFCLLRGLCYVLTLLVIFSYDINCSYSIHLLARMAGYSPGLNGAALMVEQFIFLIGKFHLGGHIRRCLFRYSWHFMPGAGLADGEASERKWANTNPTATSTREMGAGSRADTLDDHIGDANWQKTTGARELDLDEYGAQRAQAVVNFMVFHNDMMSTEQVAQAVQREWIPAMEAYEKDPANAPNPFEEEASPSVGEGSIRLTLARMEGEKIAEGFVRHTMSPSQFITEGLNIEKRQATLRIAAAGLKKRPHATDIERATHVEQVNQLRRRMKHFKKIQSVYMPRATVMRLKDDEPDMQAAQPYDDKLLLPSAMGTPVNALDRLLVEYESLLRATRSYSALASLRENILMGAAFYAFTSRFVRGQKGNTCSSDAIHDHTDKRTHIVAEYRTHYRALLVLATLGDIKGFREDPLVAGSAPESVTDQQTQRDRDKELPSWIWRQLNGAEASQGLTAALRLKWCKLYARARRTQEAVDLTLRDMTNFSRTMDSEAKVWGVRSQSEAGRQWSHPAGFEGQHDPLFEAGARAYALKQQRLREDMKKSADAKFEEARSAVVNLVPLLPEVVFEMFARKGMDQTIPISTPIVDVSERLTGKLVYGFIPP
ncbi:hypothetical protein CYLTODRAFT_361997 [Cylindrobasidium torrendii FP15055 ss-10]|uniref:CxC2-like cysteine cluster KDZ transposase-associated domain-containing protein n=1 Tax=Cylindrobasidium torrendii FP15055 ss-10 TaxID=1314674 RepID=A0A0D7AUP2_9AGAR|nr:hypothetical protein CYLTODRAFT_361997 [Cylindrobasidium torrendii FP15055 ss-10]